MKKQSYGNNAIVSYIDILGFATLTKSPDNIPKIIESIAELRSLSEYAKYDPKMYKADMLSFSDTVIRVLKPARRPPIKSGLLFVELMQLVQAQILLYFKGILIRGGTTYGKVYINEDKTVFFGPAINRSYEIESTVSNFPRIVVDVNVLKNFRRYKALHSTVNGVDDDIEWLAKIVTQDRDGQYYIDMFSAIFTELDEEDYFVFSENSHAFLQKNLEASKRNYRILSKYLWLAEKHNAMIDKMPSEVFKAKDSKRENFKVRFPDL